jgi:signal peptidase I
MRSALREVLETIVLTILIFLLVRSVVQNFKVDGHSMEPTLSDGQYLLINKAMYWQVDLQPLSRILPQMGRNSDMSDAKVDLFRTPERGDIIVFHAPQSPDRDFIKRVIAVPGERVEIRNRQVFVDGHPLHEPYIKDPPLYDMPSTLVPPNQYFVLGDHRNNSSDSHVWGVVPRENVVGIAWVSYWPPAQWGFITSAVLNASQR